MININALFCTIDNSIRAELTHMSVIFDMKSAESANVRSNHKSIWQMSEIHCFDCVL